MTTKVKPTTLIASAAAIGAGAGLMYLLDPQSGRGRRSVLGDKLAKGARKTGQGLSATAADTSNRAKGLVTETVSRLRKEELTDEQLVARVRSELGHKTGQASALEVTAQDGQVVLAGPVKDDEIDALVECVSKVRGVRGVENRLQANGAGLQN